MTKERVLGVEYDRATGKTFYNLARNRKVDIGAQTPTLGQGHMDMAWVDGSPTMFNWNNAKILSDNTSGAWAPPDGVEVGGEEYENFILFTEPALWLVTFVGGLNGDNDATYCSLGLIWNTTSSPAMTALGESGWDFPVDVTPQYPVGIVTQIIEAGEPTGSDPWEHSYIRPRVQCDGSASVTNGTLQLCRLA